MNAAAMVTGVKLAELAQRRAEDTGLTVEEAYEEFVAICEKDAEVDPIEGPEDMEQEEVDEEEVDEKEIAARAEARGKLLEAKIEIARASGRR